MIEFVPDPPLWSDGMEKQRFLLLPKDKKIDNGERKFWKFPTGTIVSKTFFDDGGPGGPPRPIETRFIRVGEGIAAHEYYVYQWNEQGTDATLVLDDMNADPNKEVPVMITIKRMGGSTPFMVNHGKPFPHDLPSRNGCEGCHTENGMMGPHIIGFDELRLNSKLTPTSAKTQLEEFGAAGLFTMPVPSDPATITDNSNDGGRLLRIKRFIFGNCAHCHWGGGQADFRPEVFVESTVGVEVPETQSVKPHPGMLRIFPGDPRKSVLYVQTERTMLPAPVTVDGQDYRLRPMPPIGVADVAADQAALADLRAWIMSLPQRP